MFNNIGNIFIVVLCGGCYCCCYCCCSAFLIHFTAIVRNKPTILIKTKTTARTTDYYHNNHGCYLRKSSYSIAPPSIHPSSYRINKMMVTTTWMMAINNNNNEEEDDDNDDNNNNNNNKENEVEEEEEKDIVRDVSVLPALDIVLERARNRKSSKIGLMIIKLQAFVDGPLWLVEQSDDNKTTGTTTSLVTFKRIDGILVLLAFVIHANSFAFGWIAGKITINPFTKFLSKSFPFSSSSIMILLLPFWPILWAIAFDQIIP
mmetsp:Transcript_51530/g.55772  ORF Transcript_51530/g.55772 Transcript_51530/m.55772 type:complete len:261 (+) Transcript_51530:45-827(+)